MTAIKEELQKAKKQALTEIVKAYELFCNYFVGKAWSQLDKITQEMHNKDPWLGVNGNTYKGPCMKTWVSFLDCIKLHKLTIFSCDAAKLQRYYMQQGMKKPQRIPVCQYMLWLGLLKNYLAHLPTVKDSPVAVEDTTKDNVPFDKAALAGIILKPGLPHGLISLCKPNFRSGEIYLI